jgi:hypothetical protein
MEFIPLFLLAWMVVSLPAIVFTAVANSRRKRDIEELTTRLSDITRQLESLERRSHTEPAHAAPVTVAEVPTIKISPQEPPHTVVPAPPPAPVRETVIPEKPKAPVPPPQPIVAPPMAVQTQPHAEQKQPAIPPASQPPIPQTAPLLADEARVVVPPPPPPRIEPTPERPPIAARNVETSPWLDVTQPEHSSAQVRATSMLSDFSSDARIALTPQLPKQSKKKSSISLEELVGTNLLPKLGIAIVVIGVGFLVAAKVDSIPHWLRVVLLYISGFAALAGGIFAERKERYRTFGRALIGGGWAVTVLVTYGLTHAPFMAILSSNAIDLLLLVAVISVMVWHTLKYDSQLVTGASFLLGFAAITLNPDPPYNLLAGLLLVAGMTIIVLRRQWFELEVFGILASYLNHFYWLYSIFELQGQHAQFQYHTTSLMLVIAYWVVFRFSYVWRKVSSKEEESVSTIAGLLNPLLFLGVMKYQSFHPEWAFYGLLALGAVEFVLGQLPVSRRRRAPFLVLSSLGATLMVAAVPFKYSGDSLETLWLVGGEAFLLAGVFTRERLFRGFGLIISALIVLHALLARIAPLLQELINGQAHYHPQLGIILGAIAAVLYFNSHVIGGRWKELFAEEQERQGLIVLSFAASFVAVCSVCALVNDNAIAIVLALLVAALSLLGKQFSINALVYQAHWIATVTVLKAIDSADALKANVYPVFSGIGIPELILAFVPVACLLYLSSRHVRLSETSYKTLFASAYTWAATGLLALLVWYQAPQPWIGVGWVALALVLALAARYWKDGALLWQTHVLSLMAACWTLYESFAPQYRGTRVQLISVVVTVGSLYLLNWIVNVKEIIGNERISQTYSWAGSLLLSWLIWYQFPAIDVALAWGLLGLALFMLGDWKQWGFLRAQSYVALTCSFAHIFYANFNVLGEPGAARPEILTVVPLVGIYFFIYWQIHSKQSQASTLENTIRVEYLLACLGTATLAALARFELPPETVAVGYATLVVATLLTVWLTRLQVFLYQALALLVMTAFRISMYNFYHLNEAFGSTLSNAVLTIALLAAGIPICFAIRKNAKQTSDRTQWLAILAGHPEQPMFFVPFVLLAVLLALKVTPGMITLAWGAQAVVVFVLALVAKEASYRRSGLVLLLLSAAKIVLWDVWQMNDASSRYLTLIGVGLLILVVSYLFSRNREALREYL